MRNNPDTVVLGPEDGERLAELVLQAIDGIRFGSVELTIHDSKVVQIERKEKFRFESSPASRAAP